MSRKHWELSRRNKQYRNLFWSGGARSSLCGLGVVTPNCNLSTQEDGLGMVAHACNPALGKLKPEATESEKNLSCIVRFSQKQNRTNLSNSMCAIENEMY